MGIDLNNISVTHIDEYITELKKSLLVIDEELQNEYSLDDLKNKSREELLVLLENYDIDINSFEIAIDEELVAMLPNNLSNIKSKTIAKISKINSAKRDKINEIKSHNEQIEKEIAFYEQIKKYLLPTFKYTEEDYQNLVNLILNSSLSDKNKAKLTLSLSKIIISESLKKSPSELIPKEDSVSVSDNIDSFDKDIEEIENEELVSPEISEPTNAELSQLRQEQIKYANDILNKYSVIIMNNYPNTTIEEISESFTLEEMQNDIEENQLSIDRFIIIIAILICKIKDVNISEESANYYVDLLKNYDALYNINLGNISELKSNSINKLNTYTKKINELYALLRKINYGDESIYNQLSELNQQITIIKETMSNLANNPFIETDNLENEIANIGATLNFIQEKINEKIGDKSESKIKSFIIFDIDSQTQKPYFYEDMLGKKKMIEPQAINSDDSSIEDSNYERNFSKLVEDLMTYGTCSYMLSVDRSSANKSEKVEQLVCETDSNGRVNRDKPTDMWRIRPNPASNIRFVDRKVTIPHNTELFSQLKGLIQKYLPNATIDDDEDFTLIVNIVCGIKKADKGLYNEAINRYEKKISFPLLLLFVDGKYQKKKGRTSKLKKSLTDDELKKLEQVIVETLQLYNEMKKQDNNYDIEFINKLGGGVTHGLYE